MKIDYAKFPYPEIRKMQKKILDVIDDGFEKYRYFILEIPTGIGKSAIAKTICSSTKNGFIVTSTKQLQDQYMQDFGKDRSIKSIKGKVNYPCKINDRLNCENGPCVVNQNMLKECKQNGTCLYHKARKEAMQANVALTSYQYFLRALECAGLL